MSQEPRDYELTGGTRVRIIITTVLIIGELPLLMLRKLCIFVVVVVVPHEKKSV